MGLMIRSVYVFCDVLQIILLIYIITSMFPVPKLLGTLLNNLTAPLLNPVRYLISKSVIKVRFIDISPLIAYTIISFIQGILLNIGGF